MGEVGKRNLVRFPLRARWLLDYERDGSWKDEDLLVQAEYEIRVTDRKWLEPLSVDDGWGSAAFPLNGDRAAGAGEPAPGQ
ncbi:hypothetical protein [Streptomyces violaceusniger]|uniref:hypothetical protein n=1 Tax=Streptomyces violaceusniger TaxID=68280 RepID=UPI0001E4DE48|nr:hypothetical protein [Streptomyces violaceusniger]